MNTLKERKRKGRATREKKGDLLNTAVHCIVIDQSIPTDWTGLNSFGCEGADGVEDERRANETG
jgi:hypothetical protein